LNPVQEIDGVRRGKASWKIPPEEFLKYEAEVLIVCPCGLDIEQTKKEMKTLEEERPWWKEASQRAKKIVLVDGNQMFNRPGPRLVEALEWLVGLLNDSPDIIPSGFPYEYLKQ